MAPAASVIYTMNGMRTQLYLRADEPGTFRGMSAHFSGDGFPDMHFAVRSVSLARPAGLGGAQARPRSSS